MLILTPLARCLTVVSLGPMLMAKSALVAIWLGCLISLCTAPLVQQMHQFSFVVRSYSIASIVLETEACLQDTRLTKCPATVAIDCTLEVNRLLPLCVSKHFFSLPPGSSLCMIIDKLDHERSGVAHACSSSS